MRNVVFTYIKGSVIHKLSIVNDMFRLINENKSRQRVIGKVQAFPLSTSSLHFCRADRKNQHINESPNKTHRVTKPMAIELIITKRGES